MEIKLRSKISGQIIEHDRAHAQEVLVHQGVWEILPEEKEPEKPKPAPKKKAGRPKKVK